MPVSFEARSGEIVAITGSNGSGKSTLLKILAHLLTPSKGKTEYHIDGKAIEYEELQRVGGFAAPYMELYAELTATEHLKFIAELKKKPLSDSESVELLVSLGLNREIASSTRYVKQYSSGMQQRVKLAMAFALESEFIFLDEPSSNLDTAGIDRLFEHIRASSERGAIVVIATNDPAETSLATKTVAVEAYKKASA